MFYGRPSTPPPPARPFFTYKKCLRDFFLKLSTFYPPLGDISPPRGVRAAMEMQAEAERKKRAQVLESEGLKTSLFW